MRRLWMLLGVFLSLESPAAAESTEDEAEPGWEGSVAVSWAATSGNTETSSLGADLGLERRALPWGLELAARGNRAEDQGVLTAESYFVAARAERALRDHWQGFAGLQWSKDRFAGLDSRTVASAGASYLAIESERQRLELDAGLAYTWESRAAPASDLEYAGGVLGMTWEWKLGETSTFSDRLTYYPNFEVSDDWRLTYVAALESAINAWLALRLGFDLRYRNQPIGTARSTDTTSTASVVFTF